MAATKSLGTKLRELLAERGFNQTTFATRTGIDRTELNRIINDRRNPKPEQLSWMAEVLGLPVEQLLDGVEIPTSVRKAVEPLEEAIRRAIAAEGERDVASKKTAVLEERLAKVRSEFDEERQILQSQIHAAQSHGEERLKTAAEETREAQLQQWEQLRSLRDQKAALQNERDQLKASNNALQAQVAALQAEVSRVKNGRVAAGFLGALAGAALSGGFRQGEDD